MVISGSVTEAGINGEGADGSIEWWGFIGQTQYRSWLSQQQRHLQDVQKG
jgi:hypothetical protein